ncbi:MAG: RNA methyltransferase [Armatimonadetes bacterium]|nr:RNA methyltransferase [Armatimonadota bacterium]
MKDPMVKEAQALNRPEVRAAEGRYLLEGEEMVEQALRAGAAMDAVFLADAPGHPVPADLVRRLSERDVAAYGLSQGLLFKIIGTGYETSATALAIVRRPPFSEEELPPASEGLMLVVGERLQDPRNVGVLVRTADAVGAPALILSADSPDPTSRPAVRSSTGSILRLPVLQSPGLPDMLERLRQGGYKLVATSAAAPQTLWDADLTGPCAFLFGNETTGLSPALRETADLYVSIPLLGGAHSLNVTVASGIVLYESLRQRSSKLE